MTVDSTYGSGKAGSAGGASSFGGNISASGGGRWPGAGTLKKRKVQIMVILGKRVRLMESGGAGGVPGTVYSYNQADQDYAEFLQTPSAGSSGWVYIEYGGDI